MHIAYKIIGVWLIISAFMGSCAQPQALTGGEKDTIPPILVSSTPPQGALNYTKQKIEFVFDEWVDKRDIKRLLFITPEPAEKNAYTAKVYKNKLSLHFNEPLDSAKTYTLSIDGGIVDLTEGNVTEIINLAFSTGPQIDSIHITGKVYDAFDKLPVAGASVCLVSGKKDTLHFTNKRILYRSQSNKEGDFTLQHISPGTYRLWAFMDENKNSTWEANEGLAFLVDTLDTHDKQVRMRVNLFMVTQDNKPFICLKGLIKGPYYQVGYNKSLSHYRTTIPTQHPKHILHHQLTENKKNIRFYKNDAFITPEDSLEVHISSEDTQGNQLKDTVFVRFITRETKEKKVKKGTFPLKTEEMEEEVRTRKDSLILSFLFPKPIAEIHYDSLFLLLTDSTKQQLPKTSLTWNHNFTTLGLSMAYPEEKVFELLIAKNSFIHVEGDSSKVFQTKYGGKDPKSEHSSRITGTINTEKDHLILELLVRKDEEKIEKKIGTEKIKTETATAFRRSVHKKHFSFRHLPPGSYYFRLIEDTNKDGEWNKGNVHKNLPPERTHIPDTTLSLRVNWVIEHMTLFFPSDTQ